jgi:carboxyl-terminal processing protease
MSDDRQSDRVRAAALVLVLGVAACSGGGGGSDEGFRSGVFEPASHFKDLCENPRTGIDPNTSFPYPDMRGTFVDENNWLRSWSNDTYLWYNEIFDRDPSAFPDTLEYFDLLKTNAMTPSGAPKDQFHFTFPTDEWNRLIQSGTSAGYGATFAILSAAPPREIVVAYTEPDTPATNPAVNLVRGTRIVTIDGVDVANGSDVDKLNAGAFPSSAGEMHEFVVQDPGAIVTRTVTMTSDIITSDPVQSVQSVATVSGPVGYMLFNDHIATSESELIQAVNDMSAAAIVDLVLDIRYNGGGFLDIANELAFMIAGPAAAAGNTFEQLVFNDKHPDRDPVTGALLEPTPFHTTTVGFSTNPGDPLPSLNLSRVFVLTGPGTCSASESIVNGLRGIDVEVIQIGSTTCGKPYGFYATDNCGTTYFTIQFKGVNAKGFGDYTDGFSPQNVTQIEGFEIPGCSVADDFTHGLGDVAEGRFAAALQYRTDGTCPAPTGFAPGEMLPASVEHAPLAAVDGVVPKPLWLQNRIVGQ